MIKTLYKCITDLDCANKTLLVWLGTSSGVSIWSITTVVDMSVGIDTASISLVFLISNYITKMFLKTMGKREKKDRKIAFLAGSKLISVEK